MSTAPLTLGCHGEEETYAAGERFAATLVGGELIALEGDLGAGKTVFVRGLAAGLGLDAAQIGSPSYVLAIEHRGGRLPLLHVDLYRLPDGAGAEDLGLDEALARGWVVAVEWGERLPALLRAAAYRIVIGANPADPEVRAIVILPPA